MKNIEYVGVEITETLVEITAGYEMPKHDVTMKNPNSKYKLSSAVQKSIRRGHVIQSEYYAQAILNGGEGEYLWRRLPIIAMEDIGLANIALCAQVIHFCRYKAVRSAVGEKLGLTYLVAAMAQSVKSRTLCDMVCSVHYADNHAQLLHNPEGFVYPVAAQLHTFASLLAWGIKPEFVNAPTYWTEGAGKGIGGQSSSIKSAEQENQVEYVLKKGGPMAAYALSAGAKKGTADLHAAMYPAYVMEVPKPDDMSVISYQIEQNELLQGVPHHAFDKHTLEGKKAIAYVQKSSKALKDFIKETGATVSFDCLALGIFQVESALLDRKLSCPRVEAIQEYNDGLEFGGRGMKDKEVGKLFREVLDTEQFKTELMHARKRVLGLVPSSNQG